MPWTAHHGLLSQPRRSLTVTRHQGQQALQCFQLPVVTSLSPPADATPLKRGSERQLACDVVVLYDCHGSIILYAPEICHVTQSALWTTKIPDMTFYARLNIFNQYFQPEVCVMKSNGARKRDKFCDLTHAASQPGKRRPRGWHRIRGDKGGAVCWSCPLFRIRLPATVDSDAWHRHRRVSEGSSPAMRRHNSYRSAVLTPTDRPATHPTCSALC
eukprot:superscaffoldBa00000407_g4498